MEQLKKQHLLPLLTGVTCSLLFFAFSCHPEYTPKPRGYFRIEFPSKTYRSYQGECPYSFSYPSYARVVSDSLADGNACSPNILFSRFNARLHLSYLELSSHKMLDSAVEDAYELAFKHVVKSTGIDRATISYPEQKVYGTLYSIDGNTASSVQFYLTDSTRHYLRGALYFHEHPQIDSIQPVLEFIKKDIDVMIRSFRWKDSAKR